jgi:hypothetical protein
MIVSDPNPDNPEEFSFCFPPAGAFADYNTALEDNMREQMLSSPLPEIFSGQMTTGNHASVESQTQMGINVVESCREDFRKSWNKSMRMLIDTHNNSIYSAKELQYPDWDFNNLDLASEGTKATILQTLVGAMSAMTTGNIPVSAVFDMIKGINPALPYRDAEELNAAITELKSTNAINVPEENGYLGFGGY